MARGVRRPDHRAVQASRRPARLRRRALHDGRRVRPRGAEGLRRSLRAGPDLPRHLHGQLGPGPALGDLRPGGGGPRGRRRHAVLGGLPACRRLGGGRRGDRPSGDDAGRYRGRGAPRRRALPRPRRARGDPAARRTAPARDRRRVREDRLRHRLPEDHPGPRSQRLRDRPPPWAARDLRHRRGRPHDRGGGGAVRGDDRGRGAHGGRRGAGGPGRDPRDRGVRPHRALLAAVRRARRAAHLAAVVHAHGRAGRARGRGGALRPDPHPSGVAEAPLPRLARRDPALVHLAPALVGAPDPCLVPRRRAPRGRRTAGGRRLGARPGRPRHVVLVGAVALRDARLARGHARPGGVLPHRRPVHGARHPLPLGRPDGHARAAVHRRDPVRRRLHPLRDPGARRPPDEQVAGDRRRPAGPHRRRPAPGGVPPAR